jgi:OOP family OmpA-OmpF porin
MSHREFNLHGIGKSLLEKNMKLARALGAAGVTAFAAISSPLQAADNTGWYGGLGVGASRARIDDARITRSLLGAGFTASTIVDDDRDVGYKIFGGYKFSNYLALEAGYFNLGKFGFAATTVPAGTLNGNIKLQGLNVDAVGMLPITEKLSAFARAGVNYAQAKDTFTGTGAVFVTNPNPSKREANYKVGLGLQYDITTALAMRLEAERYRINDAVGNKGDVNLFSVGMLYRFGAPPPAPAPRAFVPEPVAAAPEPPPKAVAPPAPPVVVTPPPAPAPRVPTRVTFSADSLFDFDKAIVKPAGKQALDKFAADLRGVDYDVIKVVGHTDRLGTHAYNMKLSTKRAEAVKAYLESAGVPAGKITASGTDGSDPVTKPGDCKGKKPSKQLIACLQPDRRVVVEVSGAK